MKIYKSEKSAGLGEQLKNNRISIASAIQPLTEKQVADLKSMNFAKASEADPHLFPLAAIMATTNWNQNDDVFLPKEVWASRKTPINKPFNKNHNQKDIIGHIIDSYCMTEDCEMLDEDMDEASLPDKFHLVSMAVIYRVFRDLEDKEETDALISEIQAGQWYVSMECNFAGFDYALMKGDSHYSLPRNDETAFLTAHLRAYGGNGVYNNHRVGRILKNLVFAGKGLVKEPANPESIIFATDSDAINFKGLETTLAYIGDNSMAEQELDAVKAELEVANTKSAELSTQLTAALATTESLKSELEATSKELSDVKNELNLIKAKMLRDHRVAALIKAGLQEDEASTKAEKFCELSDDAFAEVISTISLFSQKFTESQAQVKVEKTEEAEASQAEQEAEDDTATEDVDLAKASVVEDESLSELSSALAELIKKNRVKQKK